MRRTPALIALLAVVVAGCGGSDAKPSASAQVRATLTKLADGVQDRDYPGLCKTVFAPNLVNGLEEVGLTCPKALEAGFGPVQDPQLSVDSVTVDGAKASALVRTSALNQPASTDTVQLVEIDGGWRVSSLGEGSPNESPGP